MAKFEQYYWDVARPNVEVSSKISYANFYIVIPTQESNLTDNLFPFILSPDNTSPQISSLTDSRTVYDILLVVNALLKDKKANEAAELLAHTRRSALSCQRPAEMVQYYLLKASI